MPALAAAVAADRDQQRCRPPAERLVRQRPDHGVTREAFAAAASAPLIRLHDPAGEDRAARLQQLAGDLQAELVEPTERGQVRAGEPRHRGSIRHVEVFQMGSVRTSIIGDLDPYPARRAEQPPTPSSVMSPQTKRAS